MPRPSRALRALALTTGLAVPLVLAGSRIAGAQAVPAAATPVLLGAGQAASSAFHLELHLPGTSGTPLDISQDFAVTDGKVTATAPATAPAVTRTADATLASGTGLLQTALGAGAKTATANDTTPTADASLAPSNDLGGLGAIGALQATASVTNVPGTQANASVASLKLGLTGPLAPVATALSTALNQALATAQAQITANGNQLVTQVSGLVGQLLGGLPSSPLTSSLQDVQKLLADLPAGFAAVSQQIQTALGTLGSPGGLLDVGLIQSASTVTKSATAVTATSSASIGSVSALGGLGRLGLLTSTATASATGVAGGAHAALDPDKQILNLQVGKLADIDATVKGLQADLSGLDPSGLSAALQPVATALNTGFQTLLSTLDGVLGNLGVSVADLGSSTTAKADGTSAAATSKGIGLQVTLPPAIATAVGLGSSPLLVLSAIPVSAQAEAELATPTASPSPSPAVGLAAGKPASPAAPKQLAYTGADLPLTGGIALALGGLAALLVARRRFTAGRTSGPPDRT